MTNARQFELRDDVTVELVKASASDADVIWSARVSTQGERSLEYLDADPERSEGLIRFLMRDRHSVPLEHSVFTFYLEAPIFVTRQILKHRISSISEHSGRYSELTGAFYIPSRERKLVQVGKTGDYNFVDGTDEQYVLTLHNLETAYQAAWDSYTNMLNLGISKEVARVCMPVAAYSSMYITVNARSLMNFLSLRKIDERSKYPTHPQREIEMVAEKMENIFAEKMPIVYKYFNEFGRVAP